MPGTLKLNSGGAGNLILTPSGSVGSDVTVTLPAATATLLTNKTAGTVLQVVQGVLTTTQSTTSTSLVSSTLSATITPSSASNKILVSVNGGKSYIGGNALCTCIVYRNGSPVEDSRYTVCEGNPNGTNHSQMFLDSPSSTSALTYTVYYRTTSGSYAAYFSDGPTYWGYPHITLMEITA